MGRKRWPLRRDAKRGSAILDEPKVPTQRVARRSGLHLFVSNGSHAWQPLTIVTARLITLRSQVQILPPQPSKPPKALMFSGASFCWSWPCTQLSTHSQHGCGNVAFANRSRGASARISLRTTWPRIDSESTTGPLRSALCEVELITIPEPCHGSLPCQLPLRVTPRHGR